MSLSERYCARVPIYMYINGYNNILLNAFCEAKGIINTKMFIQLVSILTRVIYIYIYTFVISFEVKKK